MRYPSLLIASSILNLISLSGQNYQTVYSDRIAYFEDETGNVKCIRIDSVAGNIDSVLYPFHNIQQLDYDCFTPYGDSWIGEKIIIDTNGFNYFFNRDHDTIKIKTNALMNESWTAYHIPGSINVTAKFYWRGISDILGLVDSIKKLSFQVYNAAMHPIDHELNDLSIILSKNFGLIKTFNFYFFPESEGYLPFYEELQECELIGLSRPKLGIQNITWLDIFDYQPGDEIHILYEYFSADEYYTQANTIKTITKYLSRNDYLDSIIYTRERKRSELRVWDDSSSFIFKHDTLVLVIKPDSIFDKLPGEPVVNDYEAYAYSMNGQTKIQPSVAGRIWPGFDTCWSNCCVDDCSSDYYYYQGLGGPYYQCDFPFTMGGIKNQLVYYKKGDVTWGTPLVVSAIDEPVLHNEIEVYPNPASSELTVTIPVILLPLQFELINLAGTIIFSTEIESGAYSIPLDDKLEGLYIYKLTSSGFASAGKIVIE